MADLRAIAEHQLNGGTTAQEGYAALRISSAVRLNAFLVLTDSVNIIPP